MTENEAGRELKEMSFRMRYSSREIERLLTNYHAERESIAKLIEMLPEEGRAYLYPPASGASETNVRVQSQYRQDSQIDQMLKKCQDERRHYQRSAREILRMSELLDRLMACVVNLPGHLRLVIVDVVMNGEKVEEFAERHGKSHNTVGRHKAEGIEHIKRKMNRRIIKTDQNPKNP